MRYKKLAKMKDGKFKRTVGIPRELFEILVETLRPSYEERHKLGGRKPYWRYIINDFNLL